MSESTVILLGLLFVSCPISLFIGAVGMAIILRALRSNGKENGNHRRPRTVLLQEIPSGEVYRNVRRWAEDGWAYTIFDSKAVGKHDIILSKVL